MWTTGTLATKKILLEHLRFGKFLQHRESHGALLLDLVNGSESNLLTKFLNLADFSVMFF